MAVVLTTVSTTDKLVTFDRPPEPGVSRTPYPRGRLSSTAEGSFTGSGVGDYDIIASATSLPVGFAYLPIRCFFFIGNYATSSWTNVTHGATYSFQNNDMWTPGTSSSVVGVCDETSLGYTGYQFVTGVYGRTYSIPASKLPRYPFIVEDSSVNAAIDTEWGDPAALNSGGTWRYQYWFEFDVYDIEQVRAFPANMTSWMR